MCDQWHNDLLLRLVIIRLRYEIDCDVRTCVCIIIRLIACNSTIWSVSLSVIQAHASTMFWCMFVDNKFKCTLAAAKTVRNTLVSLSQGITTSSVLFFKYPCRRFVAQHRRVCRCVLANVDQHNISNIIASLFVCVCVCIQHMSCCMIVSLCVCVYVCVSYLCPLPMIWCPTSFMDGCCKAAEQREQLSLN